MHYHWLIVLWTHLGGRYLEELAQKSRLKTPARVPLQGCLKSCSKNGLIAQVHYPQPPAVVTLN